MTRIILERHGESMANLNHLYAGQSDFPLSETGKKQAELAARALSGEKIDVIYSSSLSRAYQTALPHAEIRDLEIIKSDDLREIYLGEWEAASRDFLFENYPYEAIYIWNNYFGLFRAPGGESAPAAGDRFYNALLKIAQANPGKTVLVTAHAAVIRLFYGKVCGYAPHELAAKIPFSTNASFSYLDYDGEKFIPLEYSVNLHIVGAASEILK